MLVVRHISGTQRAPYLEQYEREVDVFSEEPTMRYNLSTVTAITRTMSQSARTQAFVLVSPEELIELVANSR